MTNAIRFHLCEEPRVVKFIETEMMVTWRRKESRKGKMNCFLIGIKFQFCKIKEVWKLVAQQCIYISLTLLIFTVLYN